jgi:O-antigen/teichoic acid export membrane protein
MLAKGILSVLAVAAALRLTHSPVVATAALAACWGTILVACDVPAACRLAAVRPVVGTARLGCLLWIALPMGCVMSLDSLAANVPRYAIEAHLGPTALGHFAALAYVLVAGSQPILAVGAAVSPRLARHFVADRAAYARLCGRLVIVAAALAGAAAVAAAVAGAPLLAWAYAPEYATHARLLVWLAVAGGVGWVASALGYAITAARRFREQLGTAALALAVCALASHALVPRHGLVGAAWALLASAGVRLACGAVIYAASRA